MVKWQRTSQPIIVVGIAVTVTLNQTKLTRMGSVDGVLQISSLSSSILARLISVLSHISIIWYLYSYNKNRS